MIPARDVTGDGDGVGEDKIALDTVVLRLETRSARSCTSVGARFIQAPVWVAVSIGRFSLSSTSTDGTWRKSVSRESLASFQLQHITLIHERMVPMERELELRAEVEVENVQVYEEYENPPRTTVQAGHRPRSQTAEAFV